MMETMTIIELYKRDRLKICPIKDGIRIGIETNTKNNIPIM